MALSKAQLPLGEDEELSDLMRLISERQWLQHLPAPRLVLVASQSSGKSSLVNALFGAAVAHVEEGTGNRCPVQYHMEPSQKEIVTVAGKSVENGIEGIGAKVTAHMKQLEKENRFTDEELEVKIFVPHAIQLIIVDTPGIPNKEAAHFGQVQNLLCSLCQGAQTIPVMINRASQVDVSNHNDYDIVDDVIGAVRPNWRKECIDLWNFVNKAMLDFTTQKMAKSYFEDARHPFLLTLRPVHGATSTDWKEVKSGEDLKWFEEGALLVQERTGYKMGSDVMSRAGVRATASGMMVHLKKAFKKGMASMMAHVKSQASKLELERRKLNDLIAAADTSKARHVYMEFVQLFTQLYMSRMDSYPRQSRDGLSVDGAGGGDTFQQEWDLLSVAATDPFASVSFPVEVKLYKPAELEEELKAMRGYCPKQFGLAWVLNEPSYGFQALQRLVMVLRFIVMKVPMYEPLEAELHRIGVGGAGMGGMIDPSKCIQSIIARSLKYLEPLLIWYTEHLKLLLTNMGSYILSALRTDPKMAVISDNEGFFDMVPLELENSISAAMEAMLNRTRDTISAHASYTEVDYPFHQHPAQVA